MRNNSDCYSKLQAVFLDLASGQEVAGSGCSGIRAWTYCHVYDGTRDEMTGSSSDDCIY
jgi:hypothetical protein